MSGNVLHDPNNSQPWVVQVHDQSSYLFVGYHDSVLAFERVGEGGAEVRLTLNRSAAASLAAAVDTLLSHPALDAWQQPQGWTSTPGPDGNRCLTGHAAVKFLDPVAGAAGAFEVEHASFAGLGAAARVM